MNAPDCLIFVDSDLTDSELLSLVTEATTTYGQSEGVRIDLYPNPDFHSERRANFPDGFVHFRQQLECLLTPLERTERAALVGSLLKSLWRCGAAAIAACPFEDLLPERGGYRSERIPWPS